MFIKNRILVVTAWVLLLVCLLAMGYSNIIHHEFLQWDDAAYVLDNPHIKQLSFASLQWAFLDYYFYNWHPMTWLVYMIEYHWWGENALFFKLINLTIHLANSCVIAFLTIRIGGIYIARDRLQSSSDSNSLLISSFFVGALFAIHPQHVESVVWISELKDQLSGLFYFLAMVAYLEYHRLTVKKIFWRNLFVTFFMLSLLSKASAVTLPPILVLMDLLLLKRVTLSKRIFLDIFSLVKEKTVYFIMSFCAVALTFFAQPTQSLEKTGLATRIVNGCEAILHYWTGFFLPLDLSPFYPFSATSMDIGVSSLYPVAIVGVMLVIALASMARKHNEYSFAFFFFLISILPVIGFIKVGQQSAADRYTYIPMAMVYVGIGLLLCGVLQRCYGKTNKNIVIYLSLSLILVFNLWQTRLYVPVWKNDTTLWSRVNLLYPNQVTTAYMNLGNIEFSHASYDSAMEYYEQALMIDASHIQTLRNKALTLEKKGLLQQSMVTYQLLIDSNEDSVVALRKGAEGFERLGKYELAVRYYSRALQLAPHSNNLLYKSAYSEHLYGSHNRALEKVNLLIARVSAHKEGRLLRVVLLLELGNIKQGLELLSVLKAEYPQDKKILDAFKKVQKEMKNRNSLVRG
ncbi:MAG: tetratricopeptide repeat protein [Pseudomonadales bacterium]|nr:tetratricopeptide repeat protein [Pseudomonadales bacterium]